MTNIQPEWKLPPKRRFRYQPPSAEVTRCRTSKWLHFHFNSSRQLFSSDNGMSCFSNPHYDYQRRRYDNETRAREFYWWFMEHTSNSYRSSRHFSAHLVPSFDAGKICRLAQNRWQRARETCCIFNEKTTFFSVSSNLSLPTSPINLLTSQSQSYRLCLLCLTCFGSGGRRAGNSLEARWIMFRETPMNDGNDCDLFSDSSPIEICQIFSRLS